MLLTNTSSFCNVICSINGTTTSPCLDVSLLVQNQALLQSPPTAARHGYHFITAAQATQQMNYRVPEEGKNGGNDTSNMEGETKADMLKLNMWQIQQALHQQLVGFICKDIAMSSNRNASATSSTRMLLLSHLVM
ncbi:hypothetical protein NC651_007859 [Populus alba x Populus x berolinensis]|nr:hypothetical protein NC651_007859 [Populus alba x Populus x berolinensis]